MAARLVVAKQQFVAEVDGKTVVVLQGARFRASDPMVKGRESLFDTVTSRRRKET